MRKQCERREEPPQGLRRRESPGDKYTFSLVSDLCPQGPRSGLGKNPIQEELYPLLPRSQPCLTKRGRGPVQGLRQSLPGPSSACRAWAVPPGTVIHLQSMGSPSRGGHLPAWPALPPRGRRRHCSQPPTTPREHAPAVCMCSELLEWPSPERCTGLTLSCASKRGWAKASAGTPVVTMRYLHGYCCLV